MSEAGAQRHITEAEYRAWLEQAMPQLADELTAALPQSARDGGLRFEWAAAGNGNALPPQGKVIDLFDMVLPEPYDGPYWAPFRDGGLTRPPASACYQLPSGAMVHVKPACRC